MDYKEYFGIIDEGAIVDEEDMIEEQEVEMEVQNGGRV